MSCLNKSYDKFEGAGAMGSKFRARCCALLIGLGAVAVFAVIILVAVNGDGGGKTGQVGMVYNSTGSGIRENAMEEIVVTERNSFVDLKTTVAPEIADSDSYSEEQEYVKPIKLGPRSLHDHDILYDQMRNDREHPQIRHHSGHFRHKQAEVWDPHPQYEIDAFGNKLLLDLTYNNNLSPNLHIIHIWNNFTERVKHDSADCYYTGTVKGDLKSNVFVSLCGGMTGYIKTTEANYWIQPVEPLQDNSSSSVLHLIKKTADGIESGGGDVNFEQCETNTGPQRDSGENHRTRRSLDFSADYDSLEEQIHYPYVPSYLIETLVVVDHKMLHYHKTQKALEFYVNTLMSHVALLFKDASIGNPISLVVVDIMIVRDRQFTGHSQEMLRKFCKFQRSHSHKKHDVAILLTKDYLCVNSSNVQHCDTLGIAQVGAMCVPSTSCTVVRDKGLSTSYAIAHEIGHLLNMPHDDDEKCPQFQKGISANNIMSKSLNNDTNAWQWSNCSKHFITAFLESRNSQCLLDKPSRKKEFSDFPAIEVLPGEKFEVNKQCEMEFGNGSKLCTFMPYCENLWCTGESGISSGCKTHHNPWGEGTSCGDGMWCHQRKCVPKDRNILSPMAGGWTDWSDWSPCSRTCGGGITTAKRECKNPAPENGGPYCTGSSMRYMHCNTQACESNVPDFREQQCAKFNGNPRGIQNLSTDVVWFPKYGVGDKDDYCKLYCRVGKSANYYLLREKVTDGTKCGLNSYDICVNGVCKKAGCDNRLGSNVTLDGCGVCGGDGSTCKKVVGYVNETFAYGYNHITVIPKGSIHFEVTQMGKSYLVLRDSVTGEYILNGNFTVSTYKKEIVYGGIILMYSGSNRVVVVESVEALHNSRLKQDLIIEVLTTETGDPSNVNFTYTIPAENHSRFKWVYKNGWSSCTSICGGRQKSIPVCVDETRNQVVRSEFCPNISESVRVCNSHCNISWVPSGRTACSAKCGTGTWKILYSCEKRSLRTNEHEFVDDKHCQDLQQPDEYEPCEGFCDRAAWSYSEWSHCANTNAGCNQTRDATCLGPDGQILNHLYCSGEEKVVSRMCTKSECPVWSYGEWSPCSVTCGVGYKSRLYSCYLDNHSVDVSYCKADELQDKMDCNMGPCYAGVQWNTTNWRGCNVQCGVGEQTRDVFCVSGAKRIDEIYCENYNLLRPNSSKICKQHCKPHQHYPYHKKNKPEDTYYDYSGSDNNIILPRYDHRWQSGLWSECSKSCGGGYRRRFVNCIKDPNSDYGAHCPAHNKPSETEACNTHQCPKWVFTRWSKCLDTCTKEREVRCRDHLGNEVPDSACNPTGRRKPLTTKNCRKSQCYRRHGPQGKTVTYYEKDSNTTRLLTWKIGKWSKCCEGDTHKYRSVNCFDKLKEVSFVDAICENNRLERPRTKAICKRRMRCPQVYTWKAEEWSECNCDKSNPYERRAIKCVNSRGESVSHALCTKKAKPVHKVSCTYKCNQYTSCRDVKYRGKTDQNADYKLVLYGKEAMVHCFQMDTDNPEEYITLRPNSENYAEIYDKRLNNIHSCPYNGDRNDYCECHVPMDNYGKTEFWKVRLNITSMQIITNIFTFASGEGPNKKISYGTAGDCYSEVHCPQGQFSIDLTGTSFRLSENVKWVASGSKPSLQIKDHTQQRITGKCGGNCGYCNPDPTIGLNVEIIDTINR